MILERLTQNIPLDGSEPYLIFYGSYVNDFFCGPDCTVHPIDISLWRFFRSQGYERIVFYDGASRLYWYDDHSRQLCLPDSAAPATSVPCSPLHGMARGPLGIRRLQSPLAVIPIDSPQPDSQTTPAPQPQAAPRRAITDMAALEILNYIFFKDNRQIPTALIFTHANDLDRRNLNGENTFRELQNRLIHWNQQHTHRRNICVLIFQNVSRQDVLNTCKRNDLEVLVNFLEREQGRDTHTREVKAPEPEEILRLIHRYRLTGEMHVDWLLLPHIPEFMHRQGLGLRIWEARLTRTSQLNRQTLLEWSQQGFIMAKEHIIQNLGKRAQHIDQATLIERLSQIVGQQDNTTTMVAEIASWLGAPQQKRPLSFFLVGSSGVGKTHTVKLLAQAMQDYGFDYCELDMNLYTEEHSISRLIGSPPGYVGCEDEPRLFHALRQSSRLVILFDEIEKAHEQIFKSLMQLMDEGTLSWSRGQGDFRECILCFTSNAQMEEMVSLKKTTLDAGKLLDGQEFQHAVRDVLIRANVPPEICGRVDRFLVYMRLNLESTIQIAYQEVQKLAMEYGMNIQSIAPEFLAETVLPSVGSIVGARPIKYHVKQVLGAQFSELLRNNPRTRQVCIEANAGSYSICVAPETSDSDLTHTLDAAAKHCQDLQRRERRLDQDAMRKAFSCLHSQTDNIELLIRAVAVWFQQTQKKAPLSLFLVGVSGVGKTYTGELLAQAMRPIGFGYEYFRMNEYPQESDVSRLIGSAPGFVGSENIPRIFAALERSARLVIVLDEIEKAHPSILRSLMQLLDKGRLSWSRGEGDFRQCIICITSNDQMTEMVNLKAKCLDAGQSIGSTKFQDAVRDVLTRAGVPPEICGRIGWFLVYNPLSVNAVLRIAREEMEKFASSYEMELAFIDPGILAEIAQSVAGSMYGARPMIQRIKDILGTSILQLNAPVGSRIQLIKSPGGWEAIPILPDQSVSTADALIESARTRYDELQQVHALLDRDALHQKLSQVLCQDDNIRQIINCLDPWYSQLEKQKPLSLFFVGVSGVGKTYTAELIGEALKPYGYAFCYFSMTEFSQEFSVTNLIGSPKGYVGSEETPRLFAEREKFSRLVIVFDEIDKAHPTVFKTLMQLLDKGFLSWNRGSGDFRECVIVFTSNESMDSIVSLKADFQKSGISTEGSQFQDAVKTLLIQAGVVPELCGRIERFLVYNPITPDVALGIVFQEIQKYVQNQGYQVRWVDPQILAEIAQNTAGSSSGSRVIRYEVEYRLGGPLMALRRSQPLIKNIRLEASIDGIRILETDETNLDSYANLIQQSIGLLRTAPEPAMPIIEQKNTTPALLPPLSAVDISSSATLPPTWPQTDTPSNSLNREQIQYLISTVAFIEVHTGDGERGTGSGFMITPDGKLLTSYHVIENAVRVQVRVGQTDTEWLDGQVIAGDPDTDIAILQLNGRQLPYAPLSPPGTVMSIGDAVSLLGYPLGELLGDNITYTAGVISSFREGDHHTRLIQIDATANPGNSGGPLIRQQDGRVIGILMGGLERHEAANINVAVHIQELYDRMVKTT